jgi:hypothetical protein
LTVIAMAEAEWVYSNKICKFDPPLQNFNDSNVSLIRPLLSSYTDIFQQEHTMLQSSIITDSPLNFILTSRNISFLENDDNNRIALSHILCYASKLRH